MTLLASPDRPRPILKVAGIIGGALGVIAAGIQAAVTDGLVPADVATPVAGVVGFVLVLGASLGVWQFSEDKVTPLTDPANSAGEALTTAHSVEDVARAAAPAVAEAIASKYPTVLTDAMANVYGSNGPVAWNGVVPPAQPSTGTVPPLAADASLTGSTPMYDATVQATAGPRHSA